MADLIQINEILPGAPADNGADLHESDVLQGGDGDPSSAEERFDKGLWIPEEAHPDLAKLAVQRPILFLNESPPSRRFQLCDEDAAFLGTEGVFPGEQIQIDGLAVREE